MPNRHPHERDGGAEDHLRLTGADTRAIRRRAAMDLIEDRDPDRIVRLLDQIYTKGFRDGQARARRRTARD